MKLKMFWENFKTNFLHNRPRNIEKNTYDIKCVIGKYC